MYKCLVCGFDGLTSPPNNFTICPCCYTEYGYEDFNISYADLREKWIKKGMPWMGRNVTPPPLGWDPFEQLIKAGYGNDVNLYSFSANETPSIEYTSGFLRFHTSGC